MQYTVKCFDFVGDVISLSSVAESMAIMEATGYGNIPIKQLNKTVYESSLKRFAKLLVVDVSKGKLKTVPYGEVDYPEMDDEYLKQSYNLATKVKFLNDWADGYGNEFTLEIIKPVYVHNKQGLPLGAASAIPNYSDVSYIDAVNSDVGDGNLLTKKKIRRKTKLEEKFDIPAKLQKIGGEIFKENRIVKNSLVAKRLVEELRSLENAQSRIDAKYQKIKIPTEKTIQNYLSENNWKYIPD